MVLTKVYLEWFAWDSYARLKMVSLPLLNVKAAVVYICANATIRFAQEFAGLTATAEEGHEKPVPYIYVYAQSRASKICSISEE
jgi:hypothetical protein